MPVRSTDDQNPQFRMWGGEYSIQVIYTADAPQELISHAFQVDLSCFWGIRGCSSFSQVAPALRKDKQGIEAATIKRLHSQNPCPDEMLAARVRYLPDVSVALRDVVDSSQPMLLKPDARMLIFQGATFESCQTVPATPTAEAAVQAVAPAPRLREEEMSGFGPNM